MRLEKLRQVDLNLLITFAAIAEEKSITAAASRLLLSQPAVSRALQRARAMFQDDLLVRSPQGFELTLRGRKILQELEGLLPKMENLISPTLFAPMRERSHFRISGPDNVCTVVLPRLCRQYANGRYQVQLNSIRGRVASRIWWNAGNLISFCTLMTDSSPRTFSRKGSTGKIGFASWRVTAALVTGCRLRNTLRRATSSSSAGMPVYRQYRTSKWRRLVKNAARAFEYLISAWRCNAFPGQNSYLP
jgi:hypothetical protein